MSALELALLMILIGLCAAVLGFFLRRLVVTLDKVDGTVTTIQLDMKDRPVYTAAEKISVDAAENRTVKHERDHHRIEPPVEAFDQARRT